MVNGPVFAVEATVGTRLVSEDGHRLSGVPLDEPARGLAVGALYPLISPVSRLRIPATAILPTAPRYPRSRSRARRAAARGVTARENLHTRLYTTIIHSLLQHSAQHSALRHISANLFKVSG